MGRFYLLLAVLAVAMATVLAIDVPKDVVTGPEAEPAANELPLPSGEEEDLGSRGHRPVLKVFKDQEAEGREGKLLALYTTKTKALIVTSTAFALSTCFSTTNTPACSGRRKRNIFNEINPRLSVVGSDGLVQASLDNPESDADSEQAVENPKVGRKFTVWSTSFSTYTVVSTSYYAGTTVTVSALCNPGIAASCWG